MTPPHPVKLVNVRAETKGNDLFLHTDDISYIRLQELYANDLSAYAGVYMFKDGDTYPINLKNLSLTPLIYEIHAIKKYAKDDSQKEKFLEYMLHLKTELEDMAKKRETRFPWCAIV